MFPKALLACKCSDEMVSTVLVACECLDEMLATALVACGSSGQT